MERTGTLKDRIDPTSLYLIALDQKQGKQFSLGRVTLTPGAEAELLRHNGGDKRGADTDVMRMIVRHNHGDWGDVDAEDGKSNDDAVIRGHRIISAYPLDAGGCRQGHGDNCIWVITEADRSATTILLPSEY